MEGKKKLNDFPSLGIRKRTFEIWKEKESDIFDYISSSSFGQI